MCLIEQIITAKLIAYILLLIESADLSFLVEPWLTGVMWCK